MHYTKESVLVGLFYCLLCVLIISFATGSVQNGISAAIGLAIGGYFTDLWKR
jgi:hypothetical protein